jgi:hypothetical protein
VRGSAVIAAIVVYAVVAVALVGWAWPFPVVLPESFSFNHNRYHRDGPCQPLSKLSTKRLPLHRVGSLPSALWFGERAIYSYTLNPAFSKTYDFVVVQAGGCYQGYSGDIQA